MSSRCKSFRLLITSLISHIFLLLCFAFCVRPVELFCLLSQVVSFICAFSLLWIRRETWSAFGHSEERHRIEVFSSPMCFHFIVRHLRRLFNRVDRKCLFAFSSLVFLLFFFHLCCRLHLNFSPDFFFFFISVLSWILFFYFVVVVAVVIAASLCRWIVRQL